MPETMVLMKRLSSYVSFGGRCVRFCVGLMFYFLSSDVSAEKGMGEDVLAERKESK